MATEEDYRLREIQREYLDFLDDDVGEFPMFSLQLTEVKCQSVFIIIIIVISFISGTWPIYT